MHAQIPPHELVTVDVLDLERGGSVGKFEQVRPHHGRGVLGRRSGRDGFEVDADLRDVAEVRDIDPGGKRAAARERDDQPVGFEAFQRFADRRPTELQLRSEVTFDDRLVRPDVEHDELVPDHEIGLIGIGQIAEVDVVERFHTHNTHGAISFPTPSSKQLGN